MFAPFAQVMLLASLAGMFCGKPQSDVMYSAFTWRSQTSRAKRALHPKVRFEGESYLEKKMKKLLIVTIVALMSTSFSHATTKTPCSQIKETIFKI